MTDEDESTKVDMGDSGVAVVEGSGNGSGSGDGESEGMVMTEFLVSTGLDQSIHMVRYCLHNILLLYCIGILYILY